MSETRFTGKAGWFPVAVLLAFLLVLAITCKLSVPEPVQAQFAGQPVFNSSFTIQIPAAKGSYQYFNVPNRGQLAETVSYTWGAPCVNTGSSSATFALEGSDDNKTWFVLASSVEIDSTASSAILYSNGYFNFKRISFPACDLSGPATIIGVYTGYGVQLPINRTSSDVIYLAAQAFVSLGPAGYYLVDGFQCYNPNPTVAYLVVGPEVIGIGANQTFDYKGSPFLGNGGTSVVGAFTAPGHSTAVSTAVPCTFELNGGPFYPLSPQTLN